MALLINLRHLERDDLTLEGELPVAELDLDIRDEMVRADKPLQYRSCSAEARGQPARARAAGFAAGLRVRPLPESLRIPAGIGGLGLPHAACGRGKGTDCSDSVDLTPFFREDILLELPQHPLCKPDCGGLKKPNPEKPKPSSPGRDQNSSAWAELDKLKV